MFYFISAIIVLHECLVWIGLRRVAKAKFQNLTLLQSGLTASVTIIAMFLQSWELLVWTFVLSRLWVIVELFILAIRYRKAPSRLWMSNAIVLCAGLGSLFTGVWLSFVVGYGLFWGLTLLIGMSLTSRQANLPG
ncbi:MAG: hypothetical protein AAF135_11715 [Bacteroidota bacterium]